MKLPTLEFGDPARPPLVMVHGLFGQGKNLSLQARQMAETHHVFAVDLRNHGTAGWDDIHDYPSLAGDLYETFSHYPQIQIMGHSMGGKAAMMLALKRPEFVEKILVADMAPVNYTHDYDDLIGAMKRLDLSQIQTRRDADALMAPYVEDAGTRAFLLHSLKTGDEPYWQNNILGLEKNMPNILGWPEVKAQYDGSALFVGGGNSDYISDETRPTIKALFPTAKIMSIKNAGHWLHVEEPKIFGEILQRFFAS